MDPKHDTSWRSVLAVALVAWSLASCGTSETRPQAGAASTVSLLMRTQVPSPPFDNAASLRDVGRAEDAAGLAQQLDRLARQASVDAGLGTAAASIGVLRASGPYVLVESARANDDAAAIRKVPPDRFTPVGYQVVRTYFGTDRRWDVRADGFAGDRGPLRLGVVDVAVPVLHRTGAIERPRWYLSWFDAPDPARHMLVLRNVSLNESEFHARLQNESRDRRSAFVFVHGYNVTFEAASLRTAQMAVDLGTKAAPIFFSWPAQGKAIAYTVDEANAEWAEADLGAFLESLVDKGRLTTLYVVAHSMGTRPAARAITALLQRRRDLVPRLRELVLAAPDIDADVFRRDLAPLLSSARTQVTLYASSRDEALLASRKVHGSRRAGDSGEDLVVAKGIETVDASSIDTDFLGHSYFAAERPLLTDIALLLNVGLRAAARPGLIEHNRLSQAYWSFRR